jgi:hypothetical protein
MKRFIIAGFMLLTVGASIRADDAMYIIREYRPFCRTRVTEITRVPKIEPIDRPIVPVKKFVPCRYCWPLIEKIDAREEEQKRLKAKEKK